MVDGPSIDRMNGTRNSPSKLKIYPDKNIPKLEYCYFLSKFYVESEFGMPKLPSLGHFEIFENF